MKKLFVPLIILVLVAIVFIAVLVWWNINIQAPSSISEKQTFVIPKGYSAMQIANKLKSQGIIKNTLTFKLYIQATGRADQIKAGEYDLASNYNLKKIVDTLLKGPSLVWVTIPEGLRREEIALKFADGLEKTGKNKEDFIAVFLEASEGEGFLFPDTYLVARDVEAVNVVSLMSNTFEKKTVEYASDIEKSGYSKKQLITIASLVEREAKGDEERPIIAGILFNRLKENWPLQVDASLQYAVASLKLKTKNLELGDFWKPLTKDDLEINSPYNTYRYAGLPPSPIANPGLSSIKAAVYPQITDYWFYLHDLEGNIHYAKTIEEHNVNVRKLLNK